MIATLKHESNRISRRIEVLTRNRNAVDDYLDAILAGDRLKATP
ncbi:hypothetical protein [Nocardia albiluteola]|nr:hypothetical protein [Nocardia albiluteola]